MTAMSGRQSVYSSAGTAVSGSSHHVLNYLSSCISSVDLTCRTLESINDHLQEQTSDSKRFSRVLASKKHFDLVSEKEIKEAKAHLSAEITPQLEQLISKAQAALDREEAKAKALKTTASRQDIRLKQLADVHQIPLHRLALDTEQVSLPASATASTSNVEKLRRELKAALRKKEEKQRRMELLEKELRALKRENFA